MIDIYSLQSTWIHAKDEDWAQFTEKLSRRGHLTVLGNNYLLNEMIEAF